jgi:predicted dehydrogenase
VTEPIRVAIIGTGKRSGYMYGPIIKGLGETALVGVWGRSEDSARHLGELLGVPWYTDLDRLKSETGPQIGVVSVNYGANGKVGLMALQAGLNVLLETPIAHVLSEADAIITEAARRRLKVEVSEQFHRRPLEQVKLRLIESGLFGRVYSSFNDFAGHGYHGVSVMRSYLGFDAVPKQVVGSVHGYELAAHYASISGKREPRSETQEHGIVEFENDRVGIFHWTSVGYDCPLRWWRSSRFLAERGMGVTVGVGLDVEERLSLLAPGGEAPAFVTVERVWERCDGGALVAVKAHTGAPDLPIVRWESPFVVTEKGQSLQWHDDEIGVASCLLSLVGAVRDGGEPTYGPGQARLDQEIIVALRQSAKHGGVPMKLPLDPAAQEV